MHLLACVVRRKPTLNEQVDCCTASLYYKTVAVVRTTDIRQTSSLLHVTDCRDKMNIQ
jgi:hypothetical protein